MEYEYRGIKFSDKDVVNTDNFIPKGESNPHNVRPWLIHNEGFIVCIVFADCEQDAWDEAVDNHKLDAWLIEEAGNTPGTKGLPAEDYPTLGTEEEEDSITRLGNVGEPFDIETLSILQLPIPPYSWVSMFKAHVDEFWSI